MKLQISNSSGDLRKLQEYINALNVQIEVNIRNADKFYERKRFYERYMDYQKNLCTLNISTNEVYYKRQLPYYLFNTYTLSTQERDFYAYDENS